MDKVKRRAIMKKRSKGRKIKLKSNSPLLNLKPIYVYFFVNYIQLENFYKIKKCDNNIFKKSIAIIQPKN